MDSIMKIAARLRKEQPLEKDEEFQEVRQHRDALLKLQEFASHVINTAATYRNEALDASSPEEVLQMSNAELLKDFNLTFKALYIDIEKEN